MEIFIVDESQYLEWRSASTSFEYTDAKGWEAVRYLSPSSFYDSVPEKVYKLTVNPLDVIGDVIARVVGKHPRYYEQKEIRNTINDDQLDEDTLVKSTALRISQKVPSFSLKFPAPRHDFEKVEINNSKAIRDYKIENGSLLIMCRRSVKDIYSEASRQVDEIGVCYQAILARNANDLLSQVIGAGSKNDVLTALQEKDNSWISNNRERIILLYTDEDIEVASYVRGYFDSIDKMSGHKYDVFIIENPNTVGSHSFWRSILPNVFYITWAMAGFTSSQPYAKSDCYVIADSFGIVPERLPCAISLGQSGTTSVRSVTPLKGNLTKVLRQLFSSSTQNNIRQRLHTPFSNDNEINPVDDKSELLCFLSHNSKDKLVVREVAAILHATGIECWLDEWEILPGDSITKAISDGLQAATHLIFFVSQESIKSKWVAEELNASLYRTISKQEQTIIPVILEECELPPLVASYANVSQGRESELIADELIRAIFRKTDKPEVRIQQVE